MGKKTSGSRTYRIFSFINTTFLALLAVVCVLPFLHIFAVSFSDAASNVANKVGIWPVGLQLDAYMKIFRDGIIFSAYRITLLRMILGTLWSMVLTISAAYPLSLNRNEFYGRQIFVMFFFISMLFSGGMIPYYILIKELNLMNKIWALVVGATPVGNVILMMNFFRTQPHDLYESATIDGASHWKILTRIYLPLAKPSIATITMFNMVAHWNDWFGGLVYMKDASRYPLQTYIYSITTAAFSVESGQAENTAPRQAVIGALIMLAIIPVAIVFPLLQRHIRDGLIIGAVKG